MLPSVPSPVNRGRRARDLDHALELMYFGFRRVVREPDRLLARRGLARMHHRLLYFVVRQPGITMSALLATMGLTKQAIHRPVRDLVKRGLLVITPDERDRRVRRLTATDRGRAYEAHLTGIQHRRLAGIFRRAGGAAEQAWRTVMGLLAED